jgi:hypothetical protein
MNSNDKSFIVILDRMEQQAKEAVLRSEPCVEDQHQDGIKIGRLYMIQEVIKAYRTYD